MTPPPEVFVVGHYGAGNAGDEAVLAGAIAACREAAPGARLRVLSHDPAQTARLHDVDAVAIGAAREIAAAVSAADVVVLGGGGLLFDYGGLEPSLVAGAREPWTAYYLIPGLAAAAGKPVVMLGQGVGPFAGPGGADTVGALARTMAALTTRDSASRDALLHLGVDPRRVEVTADLAVLAPQLGHSRRGAPPLTDPYAVISVRPPVLTGSPMPTDALAAAAEHLHAEYRLRTLLVPFQDRGADDREPSRELLARLTGSAAGGLLQADDGSLLEAAVSAVAGASLVVGMRLHAVLFGIACGVPVIGLAYDPKVRAVLEDLALGEWCVDLADVTAGRLVELVDDVLSDPAAAAQASREAGDRLRAASRRNVDVLREVLEGSRGVPRDSAGWVARVQEDVARVRDRAAQVEGLDAQVERLDAQVAGLGESVAALESARADLQDRGTELTEKLRREEDARRRLEAELASERRDRQRLDEVAAQLRVDAQEQAARAERGEQDVQRLAEQVGRSTSLLRREEVSVLKPVARRAYRFARVLGRQLPPETQAAVRARLSPVADRVAAGTVQADAYRQARRRAGLRAAAGPTVPYEQAGAAPELEAARPPGHPPLPAGACGSFDVVIFPVIDWHFRIQRPQHLASALGRRGHRVVYLTTEFDRRTPEGPLYQVIENPAENVWIARLTCSPPSPRIYTEPMSDAQREELSEALVALERDLGLSRTVLTCHHPFWQPLLAASGRDLLHYDLIDDHSGFADTAPWVLDAERELMDVADVVTVTAPTLAVKAPGSVLVRNAAEVQRFAEPPAEVRRLDAPTVGYFGAIAHWFDVALVERCARENPQWRFVLIGSTYGADVAPLRELPNVELLGELPYDDLPAHLHGWDVCLIPFHVIPLTEHTNPVKAYEYLAAGKPVVATAMPEVILMQPLVRVGRTNDDFVEELRFAMAEAGDVALAHERAAWAAQHTWDQRVADLEAAVDERQPPASVVVLCYNNLELTKACLASLDRCTSYRDWQLVLVDNGSSDGTPAYLREYASSRPHVTLVLHEDNLGFAGGNNAGLAAATGDVLVLLNNDTVVTPGWLNGLVRHLRDDGGLGLVGPVTDNIGNEAKIDLTYDAHEDRDTAAARYTGDRFRQLLPAPTVAFFCVAMRRDVYDKVGGLDEAFGLGFFEDDDYCRRVEAAGYRIAIAEDVFVHHHLSASFDALGAARKQEVFEKSRAVYEAKWGTWTPHTYRGRQQLT